MSDVPSDPSAGTPAGQPPSDATAPPSAPPPAGYAPAPAPAEPPERSNKALLIAGAAVVAVLLIAAAAFVVASGGDDDDASDESTQEVFLEPADHVEDPFTPSVGKGVAAVATTTSTSAAKTTTTLATKNAVTSEVGGLPGLYGGTRDSKTCDKEKLVSYLEDNPEKGKAWADTLGIDQADIRTYVDGLTVVLLRTDTRVTNHGYKNGKATSIQAVLQAGTAVLVDEYGRPVTKCACGNPLTSPVASTATYTGTKWDGFDPQSITVVIENTVIINNFVLIDNNTGDEFGRPTGTDGVDDVDIDDLGPDDFDPNFCTGPNADPDLCVDLDATTTTRPTTTTEPASGLPSNEVLSGAYSLEGTSSNPDCKVSIAAVSIEVTGEDGQRTLALGGDNGVTISGPLHEDGSFTATASSENGTDSLEGHVTSDGDSVSIEGTDTYSINGGGQCVFQVTIEKA